MLVSSQPHRHLTPWPPPRCPGTRWRRSCPGQPDGRESALLL